MGTWIETDPIFEVGNSNDSNAGSNAITTLKNGRTTLTNKYWSSADPDDIPSNATESSDGDALVVEGHTPAATDRFVVTTLDLQHLIGRMDSLHRGYIRIVDPGDAGGQVARITGLADSGGKLKILVGSIWATGHDADEDWSEKDGTTPLTAWDDRPRSNATVVAVKDTLFWGKDCPAMITVKEVLESQSSVYLNTATLPPLIEGSVADSGVSFPIGLPSLYYQKIVPPGQGRNWTSSAFTPGAVNLQWVDGIPAVPMPFGPRDAANHDVFEEALKSILGPSTLFIDDWYDYHVGAGEVHCGSNAERKASHFWWKK